MNESQAIARGAEILSQFDIPDPRREARLLWQAAYPERYVDFALATVDAGSADAFFALVQRRTEREPMSHILGYRDFYEHRFEVTSDALDPRPETETLVAAALEQPFERVLDLGTGSGCILLSLLAARPAATGIGTDISAAALDVAGENRERLGIQAEFIRSDWFENVEGRFDLIVSNPPYIALDEMEGLAPELSYEPRIALTDEGDGLSAYRAITAGAGEHLAPGGRLMVEIGWQQGQAMSDMFRAAGLEDVTILPDLDRRDRVITGVLPR